MEEMGSNCLALKGKLPPSTAAPRGLPGLCSDGTEGPGTWPRNIWHCLLEQHVDLQPCGEPRGHCCLLPAARPCPSPALRSCPPGTWLFLDQVGCTRWTPPGFWQAVTLGRGPSAHRGSEAEPAGTRTWVRSAAGKTDLVQNPRTQTRSKDTSSV